MSRAVQWLRQNRFAMVGALLGGAIVGLIGAALAFGGGVIGFATGHYLDGRVDPRPQSPLTSIVGAGRYQSSRRVWYDQVR